MTTTATSLSCTTTSVCPVMRCSVVLPRSKTPSTHEFTLMYAVFVGGGDRVRSGGGIQTLDTPLRGITDGSLTAVPSSSICPLSKPDPRKWCRSLFIIVCGGLVYWLVYIRDCRQVPKGD